MTRLSVQKLLLMKNDEELKHDVIEPSIYFALSTVHLKLAPKFRNPCKKA